MSLLYFRMVLGRFAGVICCGASLYLCWRLARMAHLLYLLAPLILLFLALASLSWLAILRGTLLQRPASPPPWMPAHEPVAPITARVLRTTELSDDFPDDLVHIQSH